MGQKRSSKHTTSSEGTVFIAITMRIDSVYLLVNLERLRSNRQEMIKQRCECGLRAKSSSMVTGNQ